MRFDDILKKEYIWIAYLVIPEKGEFMKKELRTEFTKRQYMLFEDFEIYYYSDQNLPQVKMHMHQYYEFYFFIEGDVSIQIEKKLYSLKAGDIVLIPPKKHHRAVIHNAGIPYRRFVLWISEAYCKRLEELSEDYTYFMKEVLETDEYVIHNDIIMFNAIQSKVYQLLEEIQGKRFGRDGFISLEIDNLILYMNRIVYEQKNPKHARDVGNLFQNLISFIDDHLNENLSLDVLAGNFFVSKYHISHVFKDNMGISIYQYIMKKRLQSCRKAMFGDVRISEVYQQFGFKDYSSFYRAFKKEFGLSPKEFKDMIL